MINLEDVVRKLDNRDGHSVVAYREVGLPIFRINSVLTLEESGGLGAIEEYVLRCIEQGVDTCSDIEQFLGLPRKIVASQLAQALHDNSVALADRDVPQYELTKKGRATLSQCRTTNLTKEQIPLYVDGITRDIIVAESRELWANPQLEKLGIPVIPPIPRKAPKPNEVDLSGINRMFGLMAGAERPTRRAVRFDAIVGRNAMFFKRAIAIAYKSENGKHISIAFAVDGRPSLEHEIEFARSKDAEKSALFGGLFDADKRRREVQQVVREVRKDLPGLLAPPKPTGARSILTIEKPNRAFLSAQVRVLSVYDHPPLLREAFEQAADRILIISPWIRANVVDAAFIKRLIATLDRGIKVTIGYGIARNDNAEKHSDIAARESLRALAGTFTNFRFVLKGNTHAKVLLVDDKFFVTTSFNWLSFSGDPKQPMREEEGTLVEGSASVSAYYEKLMARMPI